MENIFVFLFMAQPTADLPNGNMVKREKTVFEYNEPQ